jgi:YVTN family beta-propeller protein
VNAGYRCRLWPLVAALSLIAAVGRVYPQWVEDSIDVPGAWVGSLVYNSREDVIYGASEQGFFFAISAESNRVVAQYPLRGAFKICYDSVDNKAYASYYGSDQDSLAVIDGTSHQVVKRMEMPGATMPVWDPVSDRVYVSCQTVGKVAVLDARSDSLLCYISVGAYPIKMHMNTLRRKLYVQNSDAGTVSVINLLTNQVIKTIVVGGIPNAGYYSRRADKYYCSSPSGTGRVAVIDGRGDSVLTRIPLPAHGEALSMDGDERIATVVMGVSTDSGNHAYFMNALNDSVLSVLNTGRDPYAMLFNPSSGLVYSANSSSSTVSVMTGDGSSLVTTLPVGGAPFVLAAVPRHQRIYVGHLNCNRVLVIKDTVERPPEGQPSEPDTVTGLRLSPSPFRDRLSIVSGTTVTADEVRIFGEDGRLMRVLNMTKSASGVLRSSWDGRDSRGRSVPAGVYFVEAAGIARAKVVKLE